MIAPKRLADVDADRFLDRARGVPPEVIEAAARITADVRAGGDDALRDFTYQFDGIRLDDPWLPRDAWERLAAACPAPVQRAIRGNLGRIERFHAAQQAGEHVDEAVPGVRLGRRPVPHRAVACYVPGGRASYPSTVLMTACPARLAGVEDVIIVTPPRGDGSIDPAVAYAALLAGASRILRAGGAQAIAAVACGTESVPRVDAIVGPGNAYVTAAKRIAADRVATDGPAGPSELLVLADRSADPVHVALDMLAQAEHDPDAQVILVTPDAGLAAAVADAIEQELPKAPRRETMEASLQDHGAILVTRGMDEAVAFADAYAAEHLEIITAEPHEQFRRIRNAGSVFLGPLAPVSLGDYGSGTNHVLPTMGAARFTGGLSLEHFRKWVTWQHVGRAGLEAIADDIIGLAAAEGLHGHAEAVRRRL